MLTHQDWNEVILQRTYTRDEVMKKALRTGDVNIVEKKTQTNATRIDNETEDFTIVKSGLTLGKEIQKGRTNKKLSQKQLAALLNEKPNVIQQYENGHAIPNPEIINKLQLALGVKLTRPKNRRMT
jgi:putative transcription factor